MKRIAIIGGGIAGLTAAYELAQQAGAGAPIEAVLFESSNRFGGIIETIREGGFTIETGPDAWVTAKPHARALAIELGLESEMLASNDADRRTHIFLPTPQNPSGALVPMPGGFHMMVPTDLHALEHSPLLTPAAIAAYRTEPGRAAELRASIPPGDESVANFTLRHFGSEVLTRIAAPLLSGIFGGDVHKLSVRAVMPAFVAMEREYGSLITALQRKTNNEQPATPVFTTLRSGLGTLTDRLVAAIPSHWLRPQTRVNSISCPNPPNCVTWNINTEAGSESFDEIFLATPLATTRNLLASIDSTAAALLPTESSSAVLVAFAYADASNVPLPPGFGFLVPPAPEPGGPSFPASSERVGYRPPLDRSLSPDAGTNAGAPRLDSETWVPSMPSLLLACTFTDQKFPHRVPPGGRLIRAFFGGAAADRIARCNNDEIAAIARLELARILNTTVPLTAAARTPAPPPAITAVRRWPNSLPQYAVGHPARIAELESRLRSTAPGLTLLGNATHGVGLPDLIRQSRAAARISAGNN
jgi:oxygen-dependent protoporphyrinogen oxidase